MLGLALALFVRARDAFLRLFPGNHAWRAGYIDGKTGRLPRTPESVYMDGWNLGKADSHVDEPDPW